MNEKFNLVQRLGRGRLILLLIVAVIGAIIVFSLASKPTKKEQQAATNVTGYRATADEFMKNMSRRDAAKTYELLTDNGKQLVGTREAWQKTLNESFSRSVDARFVSALAIDSPDVTYKQQDPHLLTYQYDSHGSKWETSLTVLKSGESWKVDIINSRLK